jgi:hypothetical protein
VNQDTLFLRQIHPTFLQNGVVSSQAFCPTEEHNWQLSLYDGDMIQPEPSWTHYTTVLKKESGAVMGVTHPEFTAQSLAVVASPEEFPEHCHSDFGELIRKDREKRARKLRDCAVKRDFLFKVT